MCKGSLSVLIDTLAGRWTRDIFAPSFALYLIERQHQGLRIFFYGENQ